MTARELLRTGAWEFGIALSEEQINAVFLYLTELEKWNRKINLTAIREERDIIIKHVLDSFSFIKGFDPAPGLKLLDMGSGAGFPAFPVKIARPEISVTLVESVKKKASFLRHIVRTLHLTGVDVADKRTNELPETHHASFDVVTARAFADMNAALSAGAPFLKPGGLMVLSRGPDETITEPVMDKAGVTLEKRIELTLPHSDYKRAIWVFKRMG
jgi:16S rRNA (guanine527-N7)-methyltransferase